MAYKNHEGYTDITAGEAMAHIRRMEKIKPKKETKEMLKNGCKPGEIWTIEQKNGRENDVLVLNVFEEYATTLNIVDKRPKENACEITDLGGIRYLDLGKLQYSFHENFTCYKKTVPDDEMLEIMIRIVKILGIDIAEGVMVEEYETLSQEAPEGTTLPETSQEERVCEGYVTQEELEAAQDEAYTLAVKGERLAEELKKEQEKTHALELQMENSKAEARIFRELYNKMLKDVLKVER